MHPKTLFDIVTASGINFFTGVPDSLLGAFCDFISENTDENIHIIAANEGNAIALAAGHYLGTGSSGLVYMQNSGIGNAVNPLVSLADKEVYRIPMLLVIGWRGEPGVKDEPQHKKQGSITHQMLDVLGIPYFVMGDNEESSLSSVNKALDKMRDEHAPVAIVVKKGAFESYSKQNIGQGPYSVTRERAIKIVSDAIGVDDAIVASTGMISRELYEYRSKSGAGHMRDFLTVGSMGHASSIAMGIAKSQPDRRVVCLDGDGAVIMHMGALAVIGSNAANNLTHIIMNNGAHDSVGGHPTAGFKIDLAEIAMACGYKDARSISEEGEIKLSVTELNKKPGPVLIDIRVKKGARADLGRPVSTPIENKHIFMDFLLRPGGRDG